MPSWVPIVQESSVLAGVVWESIDAIAAALCQPDSRLFEMEHHCNLALFFAYLARARKDRTYAERAIEHLNAAIEGTGPQSSFALYGGLCGLGWTAKHILYVLDGNQTSIFGQPYFHEYSQLIEQNHSQLTQEIDAHLIAQLHAYPRSWPYDLISGLVGFGIYFLEGHDFLGSDGIELIVNLLEAAAERTPSGARWRTSPEYMSALERQHNSEGFYNLGVAHGIPGVLFFLAKVAAIGVLKERASRLLNEGFEWLVSQEKRGCRLVRFDLWNRSSLPTPSRLAWCYNDLGIAAVMVHISRLTLDPKHYIFAHDLLEHCINVASNLVSPDAALCHGAAGVAHIMNRAYQENEDPRCLNIALTYIRRVLEMRKPGTGVGGYSRPVSKSAGHATQDTDPRFLSGAVGVALALLSAVTSIEPRWDRLMLLS